MADDLNYEVLSASLKDVVRQQWATAIRGDDEFVYTAAN